MSSKPHNKKTLDNDVELTTASEVDARSFRDEEQEENKNSQANSDEDSKDEHGVPPHRNYKVASSLVSSPCIRRILFDRFPSANAHAALR